MSKTQPEQMLEEATLSALNTALRQSGQKGLKAIRKDGKITVIKAKKNKSDRTMYYGIESIHGSELGYSYGWRYVAWELGPSGAVYDGIGVYTRRDNAIRGIKRYAKRRGFNWIISEK